MIKKIKLFLLENKTVRQTVFKNVLWLNSGQIIGRLIRAGVIIYAARLLGTDGYGIFSYALSLAMLFTIATDFGVNGILTREVAKNPQAKHQYFSTILIIKLILIFLNAILIISIIPFITANQEILILLPVIIFLTTFDTLRDFGFSFFRALEKMESEAIIFILTNITVSLFGIMALLISQNALSLSIGYTLGSAIGTLATIWVLKKEFSGIFRDFNKELIYPILKAAWPFAMLGLLGGIMINTDIIMVGMLKTITDVGLYSAAQKPINLLYVPASLMAISFFPIFSRLTDSHHKEKMRMAIEKAISAGFLIAIPMIIGGIILSQELIKFFFGSEYLSSVLTLQILFLTIIFVYPTSIIGNVIFAYNKQKIFFVSSFLGASGNVILNALLIPAYGIAGAATATLIVQILNNGLLLWMTKKISYFRILYKLPKIIAASFLMGTFTITLKLLEINFMANIVFSAFLYLLILYLIKEELIFDIKKILKFH